jgi:hypothetical protein
MCVYTHTHMYIHIYIYTHTHMHVCFGCSLHKALALRYGSPRRHMCARVYLYIFECMYMHICMYACMYIHDPEILTSIWPWIWDLYELGGACAVRWCLMHISTSVRMYICWHNTKRGPNKIIELKKNLSSAPPRFLIRFLFVFVQVDDELETRKSLARPRPSPLSIGLPPTSVPKSVRSSRRWFSHTHKQYLSLIVDYALI